MFIADIGDFLPPEELKKFMEIYKSKQTNREPDLSDYKEYKLKEDNKGKYAFFIDELESFRIELM